MQKLLTFFPTKNNIGVFQISTSKILTKCYLTVSDDIVCFEQRGPVCHFICVITAM